MNHFLQFLSQNSEKLWTLFSVIAGGAVTYFSNSASENRKVKKQSQKDNLENVLIPYCTCLEKTIVEIENIHLNEINKKKLLNLLYKDKFESLCSILEKPLNYLTISKICYLSKKSRNLLEKYEKMIISFKSKLEEEVNSCLKDYYKYLKSILIKFTNLPSSIDIDISTDEITKYKIKLFIIKPGNFSLLENITNIYFIHNDDKESPEYTCIPFKTSYKNTWQSLNEKLINYDDIHDKDEMLACILMDFIYEHTKNEKDILSNILNNSSGEQLFAEICKMINKMKNTLIKEISTIVK